MDTQNNRLEKVPLNIAIGIYVRFLGCINNLRSQYQNDPGLPSCPSRSSFGAATAVCRAVAKTATCCGPSEWSGAEAWMEETRTQMTGGNDMEVLR